MGDAPPIPTPEMARFGSGVDAMSADTYVGIIVNALQKHPALSNLIQKITAAAVPEWALRMTAFTPEQVIGQLRAVRPVLERMKSAAEPYLLEFVVDGLNQYFGTRLGTESARSYGILGPPREESTQIGRAVLTAMFQSLSAPAEITPEAGFENAQRFLTFSMHSAIEGWLLKNVEGAQLHEWFPHWGDLHELVAANLGVGRLMRRVLAPLLNILLVQPTTRKLNKAFFPATPSEGQVARFVAAGYISEEAYFSRMAELGWTRELAALLKVVNSKMLTESDVEQARLVHAMSEEDALQALRKLGYGEDLARAKFHIIELVRLRKIEDEVATLARTMYANREISEAEYRSALEAAGKPDSEVEGLLGLGRLDQSRPTRLSLARIESAFVDGLVDLSRFRQWTELEGYALEDQVVLEQQAIRARLAAQAAAAKKAPPPSPEEGIALPRASAEELHRAGIITDAELAATYQALGFKASRLAALMKLAASRRAEYVAALEKKQAPPPSPVAPRGAIEDAFVRGIVDEQRLEAFYLAAKIPAGDVPALVAVLKQRRAEFEQRQADAAARRARAEAPPARPLPQAAAEEAFRVGLIAQADLRAYLTALHYTAAAIDQLVALAERKRAAYVAALAKSQAPAAETKVPRSTEEQAFDHDLITEDDLAAYYQEQGFAPDDVELLLELAAIRKGAAAAAAAASAARALTATTKARP
jgi:hypothetical protein